MHTCTPMSATATAKELVLPCEVTTSMVGWLGLCLPVEATALDKGWFNALAVVHLVLQ